MMPLPATTPCGSAGSNENGDDDTDAQLEPLPPSGGGGKPESDIDKLSNIIKTFNYLFDNIEWKDADKITKVITEEIPARVALDKA